jgi:hemoglobin/transferrin/lactoferrin receptor protein
MFIKTLLFLSLNSVSDSTLPQAKMLNEIVITANRSSQEVFHTASSVSVLNKKDLKNNSSRTAPEAFIGINGVFVQKTNHGGGSAFVRGLTGNQTLILIDGIRLNNSTFRYGPNQYLNTIDPFFIEKIEVLRGGGSVQYGSDALGGTIQLFSAEPLFSKKINVGILGRGGSQNMEKTIQSEIGFGTEKMAFLGNINLRSFGDLIGGRNTGIQTPSGYGQKAANFKAKFKIGKGILTGAYQFFEAGIVPIYHKIILENFAVNEIASQKRQLSYLKYLQKNDTKLFSEISLIGSYQNTYEERLSQKNQNVSLTDETDKVFSKNFSANIHSVFKENYTANTGFEIYHDKVGSHKYVINTILSESSAKLRGLYPDNSTFFNYSIFSLHQFNINNWQFSAGLRYNKYQIQIPDETLGKTILSPQAWVGNTSIMYTLTKNIVAYTSYNTGFRTPNIDDLGTLGIVDFRYELPTNDLKPEKSQNYEMGIKLRTNQLSSTISLFRSNLQDLITRVKLPNQIINGYNVYTKENTEKAYIKGIEFEIEAIIAQKIKTYSSFAYLIGQNISKNEPMRRIPPFNGRIGIVYEAKSIFIRPEFLFANAQNRLAQADKDDNRIGKNGTSDWQIFNLHSGYNFKKATINLTLQNLGNKDYRTHGSGINGVGRSAIMTLELNF